MKTYLFFFSRVVPGHYTVRLEGAVTGAFDASLLESGGSVTGLSEHIPDTWSQ